MLKKYGLFAAIMISISIAAVLMFYDVLSPEKKLPIYQEVGLEDIYDNAEKCENRKNNIYSFFHLNINVKNDREHTKDRNDAYKHLNANSLNIYQKN